MKPTTTVNKKYIIFPVVLIAGIITTSIFTTATSSVLQSVKSDTSRVITDSEQVTEELQAKTSLTTISSKISEMGFVKETSQYIQGAQAPLAYR
jgi:uncharacterized membrane protein